MSFIEWRKLCNIITLIILITSSNSVASEYKNYDIYYIDKNYKLKKYGTKGIIADLKKLYPIKSYSVKNDTLFLTKETIITYSYPIEKYILKNDSLVLTSEPMINFSPDSLIYDSLNYVDLPHRFIYSVSIKTGRIQLEYEEIFSKDNGEIKKRIKKPNGLDFFVKPN